MLRDPSLPMPDPFGSDAVIHPDIEGGGVAYLFYGFQQGEPDFGSTGPGVRQKPVVVPFSVPHPVA